MPSLPNFKQLKISDIEVPKRLRELDEAGVHKLAMSFETDDQQVPIIVRVDGDGYRLIAGAHRIEAAKLLEWTHINADIREATGDRQADLLQDEKIEILENLKRTDLAAYDRHTQTARLEDIGATEEAAARLADLEAQAAKEKEETGKVSQATKRALSRARAGDTNRTDRFENCPRTSKTWRGEQAKKIGKTVKTMAEEGKLGRVIIRAEAFAGMQPGSLRPHIQSKADIAIVQKVLNYSVEDKAKAEELRKAKVKCLKAVVNKGDSLKSMQKYIEAKMPDVVGKTEPTDLELAIAAMRAGIKGVYEACAKTTRDKELTRENSDLEGIHADLEDILKAIESRVQVVANTKDVDLKPSKKATKPKSKREQSKELGLSVGLHLAPK